jgi:poly(A) polymerase
MASLPSLPARLEKAPWLAREETQAVFRAIKAGGFEARAVGGVVRNTLLGRPVGDVDIATTAPPQAVMELAARAGLHAVGTGLDHGTVTVIAGGVPFEVTTLREDVETFGRHAKVAFTGDWAADARRRDFTINALYCDADGTLYDPLGGLPDLVARRVRFIGDASERIREDYLRILRFFRITAQFGEGPPDAAGLVACVRERAGLARLSGERVRAELLRLLTAERGPEMIVLMRDWGVLTEVLPVAPRPELLHRLAAIEKALGAAPDPLLRLAALAVEVAEDAKRLSDRLRLSTAEAAKLMRATRLPPGFGPHASEAAAKEVIYRAGEGAMREALLLAWARCSAPPEDEKGRSLFSLPDRWQVPAMPIQGADVVARGILPGPRVGELLRQLEAWWIRSGFPPDRSLLEAELDRLIRAT